MPCDSVILNSVQMPAMRPDLAALAALRMGATNIRQVGAVLAFTFEGVPCVLRAGRLDVPEGYEGIADLLKVQYARQALAVAAKQNGWQVKETKPNDFEVIKS